LQDLAEIDRIKLTTHVGAILSDALRRNAGLSEEEAQQLLGIKIKVQRITINFGSHRWTEQQKS
jgi:plasmid maintenance system antidote protein VapI